MLPLPYLRPCVWAIAQLVRHYGASAVLCTATQPALDPIFRNSLRRSPSGRFAPWPKRTGSPSAGFPSSRQERCPGWTWPPACSSRSRFCASSTPAGPRGRSSANCPAQAISISPLMYPRTAREFWMRSAGAAGWAACRVVSTSLIEAGVDVDFPAVYRELSGLDSILQAAGGATGRASASGGQHRHHLSGRRSTSPSV